MPEPAFKEIGLVNEEIREILGLPPKWIFRWGSLVLLIALLLLIIPAVLIKRPEIITVDAIITPLQKTTTMSLPLGATVEAIYIKDDQSINRGDTLVSYFVTEGHKSLIATLSGAISLQRLLFKGVVITADTTVLEIIPATQSYSIVATLPEEVTGNIKMGEKATIRLDPYPNEVYGNLTGIVNTKPKLGNNGLTTIDIWPNNNLITDRNKKLQVSGTTKVKVDIITGSTQLIASWFGN